MTKESRLGVEGENEASDCGNVERVEWSGGEVCNERGFRRAQVGFEAGYLGVEVREVLRREGSKGGDNPGREVPKEAEVALAVVNNGEEEIAVGNVMGTKALTRNKAQLFPTTRRPRTRLIASEDVASEKEITEWFASTELHLGSHLKKEEVSRAKRMLYTWRDVFETDLLRIRRTDLIEHAIVLLPGAKPYRARIPLYTEEEIAFCRRLLPKMEEAGLIFRCDTEWGARTKFPLKPRADTLPKENRLRMVHNFIPLNRVTEKSQYLCPRLEQIVYTILKKGKKVFLLQMPLTPTGRFLSDVVTRPSWVLLHPMGCTVTTLWGKG